jgi:hypothetical protein
LQQIVSRDAGKGIEELRIPRGPKEGIRSDQSAGADACYDIKCRSRTGLGEAGNSAGTERATGASTGKRKDAQRFSGAQCSEALGRRGGG